MKRLTLMIVLAVLACLVCGCEAKDPNTTTTPITTAAPTETTPVLQTEPTTEPTVNLTVPVNDDITNFTRLFSIQYDHYAVFPENYYNMAMCCEFSCPEELPLATFFENGFWVSSDCTEEEQAYVSDFYQAKRLEPDLMNEVLQAYFDITLDDINWDVVGIRYWDKTGCYYTLGNDYTSCNFIITSVESLENDIVKVYYYNSYYNDNYVITLQSRISENRYGYRILSNLPE